MNWYFLPVFNIHDRMLPESADPSRRVVAIILCKIQAVPKIQNQKSKIQNPNSKIQTPNSKIQDPKSKIQDPKSKIQAPKSEIQNPKSKRPRLGNSGVLATLAFLVVAKTSYQCFGSILGLRGKENIANSVVLFLAGAENAVNNNVLSAFWSVFYCGWIAKNIVKYSVFHVHQFCVKTFLRHVGKTVWIPWGDILGRVFVGQENWSFPAPQTLSQTVWIPWGDILGRVFVGQENWPFPAPQTLS